MSNLLDLPVLLASDGPVQTATVLGTAPDVTVTLAAPQGYGFLACDVLETAAGCLHLVAGDVVLVWTGARGGRGVVLGRVSPQGNSSAPSAGPGRRLVIEADADIVIKNRNAKIVLTAEGDVEIVGVSFTSRCQRLVKLLAPLIKLN
jgi:hypothetical protein